MKRQLPKILVVAFLCMSLTSCFSRPKASCNLDQVLDVFVAFLKSDNNNLGHFQVMLNKIQQRKEINRRITADFNYQNDQPCPILITQLADGGIQGWVDLNFSRSIEGTDRKLFLIEIDYPNKRIIATDETPSGKYHRTHTPATWSFFWIRRMGMMQKSKHGSYKSFRNLNTRRKGYFKRSSNPRARSIRSRSFGSFGGSRSFMGGK